MEDREIVKRLAKMLNVSEDRIVEKINKLLEAVGD